MAHKFGDAVVLVKKSLDADGNAVLTRVNAFVLNSVTQPPRGLDRQPIKVNGELLPAEETLDLAVMDTSPAIAALKTWNFDQVFRPAYAQRPFADGLWQGWEESAGPSIPVEGVVGEQAAAPVLPALSDQEIVSRLYAAASAGEPLTVPEGATVQQFEAAVTDIVHCLLEGIKTSEAELAVPPSPSTEEAEAGQPSAADLDHVAAEQQIASETGG